MRSSGLRIRYASAPSSRMLARIIRDVCIMNGVTSPAVDALDVPPTPANPYNVDDNALSIPRTTSQVLNIVYAGGRSSGGFYPEGMNGAIATQ